MVYLSTSDEWRRQTSLLLQARPTTTRITTKYNIPNLDSPKYQISKKRKREGDVDGKDGTTPRGARAFLTLKTYCPESGVVLKFKTDRAAEVGRLIAGLGHAGRSMAALPEKVEALDVTMEEAPTEQTAESAKNTTETKPTTAAGGGGGGNKKKKKGKK